MVNPVEQVFEKGFLSQSLAEQVGHCDRYELAPLFLQLFKDHQPVLEAGCGSGRWCAWFGKNGIRSDGIDWSAELCDRAAREIPGSRFFARDMARTGLETGSYGGLIALGSIEHVPEGPRAALREFHRLLRDDGAAVITVPFGGSLRRLLMVLAEPVLRLKASPLVRRLFRKPHGGATLAAARRGTTARWFPRFVYGESGWHFYQYEFSPGQMREFLREAGFAVREEFAAFGNEGILHNFGRVAGRWNGARADVDFTPVGAVLRRILPVAWMGHMLCYVVARDTGAR